MKDIPSENEFENRIRHIIHTDIIPRNNLLIVMDNRKGTDILVCKNGITPVLFFIEVKYYNKTHGRLGFGQEKGAGFQPEILSKRPDYFEKNMRWILGSIEREEYFFMNNDQISQYISGDGIDYKQNNIQTRVFNEIKGLKKSELSTELANWFCK
jgi:hypothetical protein